MAYRNNETMRLEELMDMGINPNAILDIGAHTGQFHTWAKRVWPDVGIFMIEANPIHERVLKNISNTFGDNYLISAMGDEEREVTFYTRSDKPHTEGNSYYKEANFWDIPQLVQESKVKLKKLDNIFEDGAIFDLIKIDTQGSELDILKGGKELVSRAKAIILEVSLIEYNEGAPTIQETLNYMKKIGFEEKMSIGEHYDGNKIIQKDLLFVKPNLIKNMMDIARENKQFYKNNTPFSHINLEGIFPNDLLNDVLSDIEKTDYKYWKFCTIGNCFDKFGKSTIELTEYLVGNEWVEFLKKLTGIEDLVSDKNWHGAGINVEPRGSHLEPHTDFNIHNNMWRRVNVLLFLSKDWKDEWGGHNELGRVIAGKYEVDKRYKPEFNNVVIFNTSDYSYHGFDLVRCPENKNRIVISCYYYSENRGEHTHPNTNTNYIGWDKSRSGNLEYKERKGTGWKKIQ